MQVIIFDKFFHCIYRVQNVPREWHFDQVAKALELRHTPSEYEAFRMDDSADLCIDDYKYEDGELKLTSSTCYD